MTSSNGNIFRVTGPLWGNPTVTGGFPSHGPMTRNFYFSLICVWTNGWANNQGVSDLKRRHAHYCVTVMWIQMVIHPHRNTCSLYDFGPILKISSKSVNTSWLWPGDAMLCHKTWSALVQVMASCLMAPSLHLKQYWLTINMILWFSFHDNVYLNILSIPIHKFYEIYTFEICERISLHFSCAMH